MSITAHHTSWSSIPPEELNPLLTRQFVHGTQAMLSRIVLARKYGANPEIRAHRPDLAEMLEFDDAARLRTFVTDRLFRARDGKFRNS